MQLLGLPCASVKSPKNVRLPLPLILQLLIAMTLLLSQMMSMILQLMMSKFPHINPPPPCLPPYSSSSSATSLSGFPETQDRETTEELNFK